MLCKAFIERMKNDKELNELQDKIYAITGRGADIAYDLGTCPGFEEWKEELREKLRKLEGQHFDEG